MLLTIAGMTGAYHPAQLLVEMGSHELFCSGWPRTMILLISASQVAQIIGVSHRTWLRDFCFLVFDEESEAEYCGFLQVTRLVSSKIRYKFGPNLKGHDFFLCFAAPTVFLGL
jgi:hypothetical protein